MAFVATPRGDAWQTVGTSDELNVRLIKREISEPEYKILWEQISRARDGK